MSSSSPTQTADNATPKLSRETLEVHLNNIVREHERQNPDTKKLAEQTAAQQLYGAQLDLYGAQRPKDSTVLGLFLTHNFNDETFKYAAGKCATAIQDLIKENGPTAIPTDPEIHDDQALDRTTAAWMQLKKVDVSSADELEKLGKRIWGDEEWAEKAAKVVSSADAE